MCRRARAPGQIATLILPSDTAWGEGDGPADGCRAPAARAARASETVGAGGRALHPAAAMLLLGGTAVRGKALELAGRIAAKTGCRLMARVQQCADGVRRGPRARWIACRM